MRVLGAFTRQTIKSTTERIPMGMLSWFSKGSDGKAVSAASKIPEQVVVSVPDTYRKMQFTLAEEDAVSPSVGRVFDDIKATMEIPFVPNILRSQGLSESAIKGIWGAFSNVFLNTNLPMPLASMILYCISADKNCQYCSAVHMATCKSVGVDEKTLSALQNNLSALSPRRSQKCILFAMKCAGSPSQMSEKDFEDLRVEGVSDEEIVEVIALAALGNYLDTVADALAIDIDDVFKTSS